MGEGVVDLGKVTSCDRNDRAFSSFPLWLPPYLGAGRGRRAGMAVLTVQACEKAGGRGGEAIYQPPITPS